jgi:ATP-dependent RNA helicase DeaD
VRWTPAPTAEEVRLALAERLVETLLEGGGEAPAPAPTPEITALAERLRARVPDEAALVSLLLAREVARLPEALPLEPLSSAPRPSGPRCRRAPASVLRPRGRVRPRARARAAGPARCSSGEPGLDAKAEPGWLLPLICRRGGVTRREVGAIRVGQRSSTFEIAAEAADDFALASSLSDPRAPHVTIEPVEPGGPQRPAAAAHEPRGFRPPGAPPAHRPHRPGARPDSGAVRGGAGARVHGRAHGHRRPPDQAR